ncbi:MAG: hypothetical protein E7590_08320 [Ruminococcaceae bacterium]|nr:hypothetical protein [Oscillospiraceae bacterium]
MNRKHIEAQNETDRQQPQGEFAVRRSIRANIIAAVVCLLLAFVVWTVVMGFRDSDHVSVRILNPEEGYQYTLSTDLVEVEGSLAVLRSTEEIGVRLIGDNGDGVYRLSDNELELELPEGIQLTSDIELTVTVKAK